MKVKIFWYFEILKFELRSRTSEIRQKLPFWKETRKNQNNNGCDRDIYEKIEDQNLRKSRVSRDRSELQQLCRYNRCKAVQNNGEG